MDASFVMYSALVAKAVGLTVPAMHDSLFTILDRSSRAYDWCYVKQRGNAKALPRPGTNTCKACEKFHLGNQKPIDKDPDVELGHEVESIFQGHVNGLLASSGLTCRRADTQNLHMPDFGVGREGEPFCFYFEFKTIFRPFLKISTMVNQDFECYANSLTLDVSNGKKLEEQRKLVENEIGVEKVAYVYWYDLPCVKGIFWMPANEVYAIADAQDTYDRKNVSGDFSASGQKRGATRKVYLPLLFMGDFQELVNRLHCDAS